MTPGIRFQDAERLPLEERAEVIRKQGFECVQIDMFRIFEPFEESMLTPGLAMHMRRICSASQLDVAVLGCYFNLLHPAPKSLKRIQARYCAHVQFASWLGCGLIGTQTGCPNEFNRYEPACHSEESFNAFIHNIEPVVECAEKLGVVIGIEPAYVNAVYNPDRARRLLDALQSPNVKIIFDPVSLISENNAPHYMQLIDEALDQLGYDIAAIHLKDVLLSESGFRYVAAGMGQMDFNAIFKFIKRRKPYIQVILEETLPANAQTALQNVRKAYDAA